MGQIDPPSTGNVIPDLYRNRVKQEVSITKLEDLKIINQARDILNPNGSINEKKGIST